MLCGLAKRPWALVTLNYEHRMRGRFLRTGLPVPGLIVDSAAVAEGKPPPVPYLRAAARLGAEPGNCLVHRRFEGLREAVPHILAFASGSSVNAATWARPTAPGGGIMEDVAVLEHRRRTPYG